ncbi:MAG: hypothetical protein K2X68_11615 [Novosphingobium sp.]|nr:hypothetical protein [Novosphingobium sp.]
MILTYEDDFWQFSARSARRGDVVHRCEGATLSESCQKSPFGLPVPPAGLRRGGSTMHHIAFTTASRQRTGLAILIGQDRCRLV